MNVINSLPGGGKKFSASVFNSKFKYLSKQGGDIAKLSPNQEAIMKAIKASQDSIRRGTFSKSQQNTMLRRIKAGGDFKSTDLKTVKKIVDRLANVGEIKKEKSHVRIIRADDGEIITPGFANQQFNKGSGLSDVSSPKSRISVGNRESFNSISQLTNDRKNIKSSPVSSTSSRPPKISLLR